jgi:hypothetical protein
MENCYLFFEELPFVALVVILLAVVELMNRKGFVQSCCFVVMLLKETFDYSTADFVHDELVADELDFDTVVEACTDEPSVRLVVVP